MNKYRVTAHYSEIGTDEYFVEADTAEQAENVVRGDDAAGEILDVKNVFVGERAWDDDAGMHTEWIGGAAPEQDDFGRCMVVDNVAGDAAGPFESGEEARAWIEEQLTDESGTWDDYVIWSLRETTEETE